MLQIKKHLKEVAALEVNGWQPDVSAVLSVRPHCHHRQVQVRRDCFPHHILSRSSLGREETGSKGSVWGKRQQTMAPPVFVERRHTPLFLCIVYVCFPTTVAKLFAKENIWPAKSKILTIWPFTETFADLWFGT